MRRPGHTITAVGADLLFSATQHFVEQVTGRKRPLWGGDLTAYGNRHAQAICGALGLGRRSVGQQLVSSGLWLRSWARAVVNAARAPVASGRNTAAWGPYSHVDFFAGPSRKAG